jgi:UDP-2-acetamido-2,6-beta-L-arabino-hexul-4-ose reductase
MNILITGGKGFIGQNLAASLSSEHNLFLFDVDTESALLDDYCRDADFVFHLAGVNRPPNPDEFMTGNFGFTRALLDTLKKHKKTCPVMLSSSTQAQLNNPYGQSKKAGEELLFAYGEETGARVLVYRFPNVFGKWCRPNYNSAVATFCHNVARDLPIQVSDPANDLTLVYIDDVVREMICALAGKEHKDGKYCAVTEVYQTKLGTVVDIIQSFRQFRSAFSVADMADPLTKKLYGTYLSYLPENAFSYPLKMNVDSRGSFTEFLRTTHHGQVSVNISKPHIVKGNHWHHSKNEKFLVVSGQGVIRFRKPGNAEIFSYEVSGEKLEVVDIPPGYTHNIENLGDTDLVTVMWVNEPFDKENPDTFFLEV